MPPRPVSPEDKYGNISGLSTEAKAQLIANDKIMAAGSVLVGKVNALRRVHNQENLNEAVSHLFAIAKLMGLEIETALTAAGYVAKPAKK